LRAKHLNVIANITVIFLEFY